MSSILEDIKKLLGIPAEHTEFDTDIRIHINSAFSTLRQLGVGPSEGFMISDEEAQWVAFTGSDIDLNAVQTYIYLRVKYLFDPPAMSFHNVAVKEQIQELEWRLNQTREETQWVSSAPSTTLPISFSD